MSGKSGKGLSGKGMAGKDSRNPCIGLCRFAANGACLGCHRTKAEVKGWKRLSDAAKAAVNRRLRQTLAQENGQVIQSEQGEAPPKRLRKLDRKIGKLEAKLALLRTERDRMARPGPTG
ncbi:DUF1289 domain-containing protein [Azospirillum sp. B510]|uniref:DUF1289 domain-containing protein n=1 Tax=Azospirillum sp. (strain B510) TaxID=137722 RepID=UPI001FFFCF60|nr:DUF1289 domain-containing protein [Azospirillum sp. B510]